MTAYSIYPWPDGNEIELALREINIANYELSGFKEFDARNTMWYPVEFTKTVEYIRFVDESDAVIFILHYGHKWALTISNKDFKAGFVDDYL